jgi:hypothetical protein
MKEGIETLATKDDLAKLQYEIKTITDGIRRLCHDFRNEIRIAEGDLIIWMFIFWLAQVEAIFLIFLYFVNA